MKLLVISPLLPSPVMPMRGLTSSTQFRQFRESGVEVRAVVPVAWAPPLVPRKRWQRRRAVPALEVDHGTAISHPRFFSLGRPGRWPGLHALQRILYWLGVRREVRSFLAAGGALIHLHSCALPGAVAGRIGSAKLIISMHDDELFDTAPAFPAVRRSVRKGLQAADAAVYVSATLQKLAEQLVGDHAATVIPIGIDTYRDVVPAPDERFTIVTAARLIPRKNVDVLLEAFSAFRPHAPEARLIVAGDGPERARLEAPAGSLGIRDAVEFAGHLPHKRVMQTLARGHVFVLPSVREALGAVYFEAMSLRVPVVGTQGEGIADYVTDGVDGFLTPPADVDPLVEIMRSMYEAPDKRRLIGQAGYELYERTGVRWGDYVERHIELYRGLLRDSVARRDD